MTAFQYRLEVKDSEVLVEKGNFFPANPFRVKSNLGEIKIIFTHSKQLKNNDRGEVVYQVFKKDGEDEISDQLVAELTHPDYAPELKPGKYRAVNELKGELLLASVVMVKLGLVKDKNYIKELSLVNLKQNPHPNFIKINFVVDQLEQVLDNELNEIEE